MRTRRPHRLAVPSQPALSPDGSRVVYVLRTVDADRDGYRDQLWTVAVAGGAPRRLTAGPDDTAPAWSPDGSRLAFLRATVRCTCSPPTAGTPSRSPTSRSAPAPRCGARTAPGSRLCATVDPGRRPGLVVTDRLDYQADGAGLYGAARQQLHVVDLASGECRQVTDGDEHAGGPAWSPDASTIAFVRKVGDDSDLTLPHRRPPRRRRRPRRPRPRVVAFAGGVAGTVSYARDGDRAARRRPPRRPGRPRAPGAGAARRRRAGQTSPPTSTAT